MRNSWLVSALALATMFAFGCKKKGDGGGAWAVGDSSTMIQIDSDGFLGDGYNLEVGAALLDIDCRGATDAFVVGERGMALRTFDAGASWEQLDLGITSPLRGVVAAQRDIIYVVGDGVALVSADSGDSWQAVPDAGGQLVGVATDATGNVALMVSASGDIRLYDRAQNRVTTVYRGDGIALSAVAITGDRRIAVAAGDNGRLLESRDGGYNWTALAPAVSVTLHGVWLSNDGTLHAVGDAGTLVTLDARRNASVQNLEAPGALRSLHLSADGAGMIVGDGGAAFRTVDFGATWLPVDTHTSKNLYAVDDVHPAPHL